MSLLHLHYAKHFRDTKMNVSLNVCLVKVIKRGPEPMFMEDILDWSHERGGAAQFGPPTQALSPTALHCNAAGLISTDCVGTLRASPCYQHSQLEQ